MKNEEPSGGTSVELLQQLAHAGSEFGSARSAEEVETILVREARAALKAQRACVAHGDSPDASPCTALAVQSMREHKPSYVASAEQLRSVVSANGANGDVALPAEERAWACVPLVDSGALGAALVLAFAEPRRFTRSERSFLETLSSLAAEALGRMRMALAVGAEADVERVARIAAHARALADAGRGLSDVSDAQAVVATAARAVVPAIADFVSATIYHEGAPREFLIAGRTPEHEAIGHAMRRAFPVTNGHPVDAAFREQRSRVYRLDAQVLQDLGAPADLVEAAVRLDVRSYIVAPLVHRDRPMGVMTLVSAGRKFDDLDLLFAEELARRLAVALDNAAKYRSATEAAERSARAFADAKQREENLEDASRRKDEFLAMLAHELRSPLAPIKLCVQMLRSKRLGEDRVERYLAILERQTVNLAHIVDDLIEVSRVSRGAIELRREPVDLCEVVRRVEDAAFPAERPRSRRVSVELPSEPVWVEGDAVRLEQIVANLLSNAIRYTDEGGSIVIALAREEGTARLTVRDDGVGIAPDKLDRIFELFGHADESIARTRGGLGIGLTIVRRLVELHGGRIRAHSAGRGYGTMMEIVFPTCAAPAADVVPMQSGVTERALRVLVVDDDDDARSTMADAVGELGHAVEAAGDGITAIAAARVFTPDLVLLDVGLPDVDGYEVARRLRDVVPAATLIAVTGYGQSRDRERARAAGFDAHLVKPVDLDALTEVLAARAEELVQASSR